jgi:hypothetical protein
MFILSLCLAKMPVCAQIFLCGKWQVALRGIVNGCQSFRWNFVALSFGD